MLVLGETVGAPSFEVLRAGFEWELLVATTMRNRVFLEIKQSHECPSSRFGIGFFHRVTSS